MMRDLLAILWLLVEGTFERRLGDEHMIWSMYCNIPRESIALGNDNFSYPYIG